jgi:hypothetical protein
MVKSLYYSDSSGFFGMDDSLEICQLGVKLLCRIYRKWIKARRAQAFYFNKSSELFKWMSEHKKIDQEE